MRAREAGRAARPSRVRRAIPCRSHRASSGVGPGKGNRAEGTPDPLGLSSPKALWQVSNERRSPRCHVVAPCVRGVAGAHSGSRCHELLRRIRPARPNAAIPADVASQLGLEGTWPMGDRGLLLDWRAGGAAPTLCGWVWLGSVAPADRVSADHRHEVRDYICGRRSNAACHK